MAVQRRGGYIPNPDVQPGKANQSNQEARENQFAAGGFRVQSGRHEQRELPAPDIYVDWHYGANLLSPNGVGQFSGAVIGGNGVIESGNRQAAGGLSQQQIEGGEMAYDGRGFPMRFNCSNTDLGYSVGPYGFCGYGT